MWLTGCCPCSMPPLSTSVMDPKEQQRHYNLSPATSQELPEWGWVQRQTALGTQLQIFPRGLLQKPFPKKDNCKATVIIARWLPLALQNRNPLTDLVLTSIWVSYHPPHNFPCERWWGCQFSRRLLDPEADSTGLQVTSSKSITPDLDAHHDAFATHHFFFFKLWCTSQAMGTWLQAQKICSATCGTETQLYYVSPASNEHSTCFQFFENGFRTTDTYLLNLEARSSLSAYRKTLRA